jgi:phosphoacetylglucosamine mutase
VEPAGLQPALNRLVTSTTTSVDVFEFECGWCFVRASGTENVVRVYAEAKTRAEADRLATQTARLVHEYCGGEGPLSAM